jgi:histidyl-tRNA synthetase
MSDLFAPEIAVWQRIEAEARRVFDLYGYSEIRTPVLEKASVFERSLGDTTDVVQKEMYAFEDRGGRRIALRPEGTAGVIRHVASRGQDAQDARLYYIGPMFRAERPQAGRKRQFHQVGSEFMGPPQPAADAETLALQLHLLQAWGLSGFEVRINTLGLPSDRPLVQQGLRAALGEQSASLCDTCRQRLEANVLRVLDCKNPTCRALVQALPPVTTWMAPESRAYLDQVMAWLKRLDINAVVHPALVRGFDYYVHTVWEITHSALGAQDALCGGGRYRIQMGGRDFDGVGFAMGMERVIMALQQQNPPAVAAGPMIWLVSLGEPAFQENLVLAQSLRRRGLRCGLDLAGRSMKAQMRAADRAGATRVVIRGETEMAKGTFVLKDMAAGSQLELDLPALMERLVGA